MDDLLIDNPAVATDAPSAGRCPQAATGQGERPHRDNTVPLTMTGLRVKAVWDKRGPYARIMVLAY